MPEGQIIQFRAAGQVQGIPAKDGHFENGVRRLLTDPDQQELIHAVQIHIACPLPVVMEGFDDLPEFLLRGSGRAFQVSYLPQDALGVKICLHPEWQGKFETLVVKPEIRIHRHLLHVGVLQQQPAELIPVKGHLHGLSQGKLFLGVLPSRAGELIVIHPVRLSEHTVDQRAEPVSLLDVEADLEGLPVFGQYGQIGVAYL